MTERALPSFGRPGLDRPLRVFADQDRVKPTDPYIPLLFPFLEKSEAEKRKFDRQRFDVLMERGPSFLQLTSILEADCVVSPVEWQEDGREEWTRELSRQAESAGKPFFVLYNADSPEPLDLAYGRVVRTSLFRRRRGPNECALPAWSDDHLVTRCGGVLTVRPYTEVPTVGYSGYSDERTLRGLLRRVRQSVLGLWTGRRRPRSASDEAVSLRGRALRAVGRTPGLRLNFVRRESGLTGIATIRQREEFVDNLVASDYALVARGAGNFSYRLYEAMSLGRIPLFVDTDCVLPLEDVVPYRSLMPFVDEKDVGDAGRRLLAYHRRLTPAEFAERQMRCRAVWEEFLSPHGFFANFWRLLPNTAAGRAAG
jgi:hypothetical protein